MAWERRRWVTRARMVVVVTILPAAFLNVYGCGGKVTAVADSGSDATTRPCGVNEVLCSGTCFPNDVNHCGPSCAACGAPQNGAATCDGTSCGFKCNSLQCGSACVDSDTDTHNCGACGHDCLGTPCMAGICQPENLYPNESVDYMSGDDTNLYWTKNGYLYQAPKAGGAITTLISGGADGYFTLDTKNVYVTFFSSFQSTAGYVPIDGGPFTPLMVSTTNNVGFAAPAVDSQFIYDAYNAQTPTVFEAPLDGGADATQLGTVPNQAGVTRVFRTGNYLYLAPFDGNLVGTLTRLPLDDLDAGFETVYTADAANTAIGSAAFDDAGTTAYVQSGRNLVAVALDGGAPAIIASSDYVRAFLDGDRLYWSEGVQGSTYAVKRLDLGTSITTTIKSGIGGLITGLFVDSTYVYWAYAEDNNGPNSGIYRIAK